MYPSPSHVPGIPVIAVTVWQPWRMGRMGEGAHLRSVEAPIFRREGCRRREEAAPRAGES